MDPDGYCRGRFIELAPIEVVPNQDSFGRTAHWLAHISLNHLTESLYPPNPGGERG